MRHLRLLLASTALLLSGCGSSDGATEDSVFLDLLRMVPDQPEYRQGVIMGDVERTREALGVERPSGEYDEAAVEEYFRMFAQPELEGFAGALPAFMTYDYPTQFALSNNAHDALGISVFDVEHWLSTGSPPEVPAAIRGTFDPDAIAANLEACAECPPAAIEEHGDWRIYAWGDDMAIDRDRILQPPLFDSLWRGGRLAVSEHLIARTLATDTARGMVEAYEGDGSLADVEDFRIAVSALEAMDVLGMMVSDRSMGPDVQAELPDQFAELWEVREGETALVPYEVYAVGPGWDEGPYTAVVLVHATDEQAKENARRFEDRVNSTRLFTGSAPANLADNVERVEVSVEGRVLSARIEGYAIGVSAASVDIPLATVPLLVHE